MKKMIRHFVLFSGLILLSLSFVQSGFAGSKDIFSPEIEKAVDAAIVAWTKEDASALKAALERLTLNETYLMAVGKSNKERSYLVLVPKSLGNNFNGVAAYLFLLRKQREGLDLRPLSLFEGKRFEFLAQGSQ